MGSNHSRAFISAWGPMVSNVGAWPLANTSTYEEDLTDYNAVFRRHTTSDACTQTSCDILQAQSSSVSYSAECANDAALTRCGVVANGNVFTCCRNERDTADAQTVTIRQDAQGDYLFSPSEVFVAAQGSVKIVNAAGFHPLQYEDESSAFTLGTFHVTIVLPFENSTLTLRRIRCQVREPFTSK